MARGTIIILFFLVTLSTVSHVSGKDKALGELEWCKTLCLCHTETKEEMHCFEPIDIYGLLQIDKRQVNALLRSNFDIVKKLTWCKDECLCHREGKKEFKCTTKENLQVIGKLAPHLEQYLNPYHADIVELERVPVTEDPVVFEEKKPKKDKKKPKKHKKNKKKNRKDEFEVMQNIQEPMTEPVSEPEPVVLAAGYGPAYPPLPTNDSQKLYELKYLESHLQMLISKVMVNRYLVLIALGIIILFTLGMFMYCCFKCCGRCCQKKGSKEISTKSKKSPKENDDMKVNMTDGW